MKKIFVYSILLFLISCSKTESDSPIVGKWEAISFITSSPVDENEDGIKNTDLKKEIECIAMGIDFRANGELSIESTNMTYDISFENGEVVIKPKGCEGEIKNGTWDVNDSNTKLYFEFSLGNNAEPDLSTINIALHENRFIMKDMDYDEGEITITYSVEFRKI